MATTLQWYVDRIRNEKPGKNDGTCLVNVLKSGSDTLAQLELVRAYDANEIPALFEPNNRDGNVYHVYHLYIGLSALELLSVARKTEPYAVHGLLFIEINEGDILSDAVWITKLQANSIGYAMARDLFFLTPILTQMQGRRRTADLKSLLKPTSTQPPDKDEGEFVDILIDLMDDLRATLVKTSKSLASDFHVPRELWHPGERPKDFNKTLSEVGAFFDRIIGAYLALSNQFIEATTTLLDTSIRAFELLLSGPAKAVQDFVSQIGVLADVTKKATEFVGIVLQVLKRVRESISNLGQIGQSITEWFDTNRPNVAESLDTLIGFFGGLWDGIVDAIVGIIETAALILALILGLFRIGKNFGDAFAIFLEVLDEIFDLLARIPWGELWRQFRDEIYPVLKDDLVEKLGEVTTLLGEKVSQSSSATGYYFGYLVYLVAEVLFPPMKLTKAAGAADDAARLTSHFFNRLAAYHG